MSNRLDTIAPSLALKLVALSKEDQRAVALSACQIVADDLKINNPIIALAVDGLSQGIALPTHVRRDLDSAAAQYDDSYFANQDEGKSADIHRHINCHVNQHRLHAERRARCQPHQRKTHVGNG